MKYFKLLFLVLNFCSVSSEADFEASLTPDATVLAGSNCTLRCQGVRGLNQAEGTTLEVEWLDPNGTLITSETTGVMILGVTSSTTDATLVSYLNFPALSTSQAGPYYCRVNHTIPGREQQSVERVSTVSVQSKLCFSPFVLYD